MDIGSLDMPVHVVATAVKTFFSSLAEPLIPSDLHNDILECIDEPEVGRVCKFFSRLKLALTPSKF